MVCAKIVSGLALCAGLFLIAPFTVMAAKGSGSSITTISSTSAATTSVSSEFQWKDHSHLSWEDFRGPVHAESEESAAATNCSIGFKTIMPAVGSTPEIVVYNKFYINRSWVRSDAKVSTILTHEQGHFDLCEVYTRELKRRMDAFRFEGATNVRQSLYNIYEAVSREYEARQQAYEQETAHGTILGEQARWVKAIALELEEPAHIFWASK